MDKLAHFFAGGFVAAALLPFGAPFAAAAVLNVWEPGVSGWRESWGQTRAGYPDGWKAI